MKKRKKEKEEEEREATTEVYISDFRYLMVSLEGPGHI